VLVFFEVSADFVISFEGGQTKAEAKTPRGEPAEEAATGAKSRKDDADGLPTLPAGGKELDPGCRFPSNSLDLAFCRAFLTQANVVCSLSRQTMWWSRWKVGSILQSKAAKTKTATRERQATHLSIACG